MLTTTHRFNVALPQDGTVEINFRDLVKREIEGLGQQNESSLTDNRNQEISEEPIIPAISPNVVVPQKEVDAKVNRLASVIEKYSQPQYRNLEHVEYDEDSFIDDSELYEVSC
jgi:hypothetical protein